MESGFVTAQHAAPFFFAFSAFSAVNISDFKSSCSVTLVPFVVIYFPTPAFFSASSTILCIALRPSTPLYFDELSMK